MHLDKDHMDDLFQRLEGTFDTEEPNVGHQNRFMEKLQAHKEVKHLTKKRTNWWKPLSIAASMAVLLSLGIGFVANRNHEATEIAPEVQSTQFYFTALINQEIEKVNAEVTPETKQIVDDAMLQLDKLEKDYQQLENAIKNNGDPKQILHAMIINFQTRIDLLQDVLQQIENVKQINNTKNESNIV